MSVRFERSRPSVVVRATIVGPRLRVACRLAVDTGATYTAISPLVLERAGFDVGGARGFVPLVTLHGSVTAPVLSNVPVATLGHEVKLTVVAYQLPAGVPFHGLLGLDFFRDSTLTIDLANGVIDLMRQA